MRIGVFAGRNIKELIRDPLTLGFEIGFPVILLALFAAIQSHIPVNLYAQESLTPAMCVFSLSFITLFCAQLIAKDRGSSFFARLFISPMTPSDFLIGYTLPMLPMAICEILFCFAFSLILGMDFTINIFLSIAVLIPVAVMNIALGLLFGTVLSDKQVAPITGTLLTNFTAWLSGAFFDLSLVGGWFNTISHILPFANAVDAARAAMYGNYSDIVKPLLIVLAWTVVICVLAVVMYSRKIKADK